MDPFNAPAWGSAPNYQADLQSTVAKAAPLAQNYNGAQTGVNIQQVFNKAASTPQSSNISKFAHFIGGIGSEIGHIAGGAASWLGQQGKALVTAVPREAQGFSHAILDNMDINANTAQSQQNSDSLKNLHSQYKSGKLTSREYQTGLKLLIVDNNRITESQLGLQKRIQADKSDAVKATIDTAALLTTILTAGFGKAASVAVAADGLTPIAEKGAADYLASKAAVPLLNNVEQALNRLATNPELFNNLAPAAQKALQTATAEVVASNGGTMTAAQIARASAANVALKYPIYYNMLSSQGQEIYQKLDDQKYGDAVRQLAVNAGFLLSGGAIGQALKVGGKVAGAAKGAIFGRTSFLDELSKGIGDGNPAGLFNAVNGIEDPGLRKEVIQNLSAVEATNMAAATGKDAVAAAWRVLNGMASYEGISMNQFNHEDALDNMVNFAKAQRLTDEVSKAHDLGPITVGRVDVRAKKQIGEDILNAQTVEGRLKLWDQMKQTNPNQAWANNDNFDRQIKSLIEKHGNPEALSKAIKEIKATVGIEGFPEKEAKQLAKMGYLPIKPVKLEAPFQEGTGRVASKFAEGDDFFTKAVQPLPVLSSVGSFLVKLGLSPSASTSRVYQVFNQNLSENLSNLSVSNSIATRLAERTAKKGAGETIADASGFSKDELAFMKKSGITQETHPELFKKGEVLGETSTKQGEAVTDEVVMTPVEASDYIIKTLSNYAHNPSRGIKVNGKPLAPITDMRQLTTKDIAAALKVDTREANDVRGALMDSMLQVPLQVRGLGDKIVDLNYKLNPVAGRYARIQGAARFAWNPFFQAKLAAKTEILSQAEVRGKFPTLAGTNSMLATIFPDKYKTIDDTRELLRTHGIFEEKASLGEAIGGEAVNDAGLGANLTHKLIPSQERSIASMVQVQADRVGLSTQQFVENFPNEVRDTVQMIAQYDRNSEFLNSSMARTLNLAFFPFRFEYKVASIMARSLAQTSPMTQLAVINGLYRAHDWLNSTEGQAWYSQNSDVIGLIKYFTPISTLGEVSHLLGGNVDSVGSLGELGGLPFGWIPQLLDAEGLTNFGGAYVSPKTGQTLPDYIPVSDKGKLASAIQDFIGSLYTYPGATAGLPSKSSIDRNIALGVTGASTKKDYNKVMPQIPPGDQSFSQTVQNLSNQTLGAGSQQNVQTPPPAPQLQSGTRAPVQASPLTTPLQKPTKGGASSGKKKKAEFTPQLLPGQTQLGQL